MMDAEKLYAMLKEKNEPAGFFFNRDRERVLELLEALLLNKQRYGYMACPCRLAGGEYAADRDIICPCAYRADDVAEFGSCYCNLYVSADWNAGRQEHVYVPERRPLEKMPY